MNRQQPIMKVGLILAFNPTSSLIKVTSHHLTDFLLSHQFKVIYISDAVSPFHLLKLKRLKTNIKRIIEAISAKPQNDSFLSIVPFAFIPVENIFPFYLKLSAKLHVISFWAGVKKAIESFIGKDYYFDLVWINNPKFSNVIEKIKYKHLVYSIEDDLFEFSRIPASLKLNHKKLIQQANLVTVTSDPLLKKLKSVYDSEVQKKILLVRNGVNFSQFNYVDNLHLPPEFSLIPEPRIIYIGVIAAWFDLQLLARTAQFLPHYSFVVIGSVEVPIDEVCDFKNIYFLGTKPHSTLSQYLQNSQVGIIPFLKTKLVESVNPIKLYEYMAAGLPVVSTTWRELEELNSPALLAKNEQEFIDYIERVVKQEICIDKQPFIDFAKSSSWDARFSQIMP